MGVGPEHFSKDDILMSQAHEKMLMSKHQRTANQNHNELSPHICQNGQHQEINHGAGENMEEREPSRTVGGD